MVIQLNTSRARQILSVDNNASFDEVKYSYRKLVLEYHPDKTAHLGEEQAQESHLKFLEIIEAYKELEGEITV